MSGKIRHSEMRILGEQIAILERRACSSFAALQEAVQKCGGGRGGCEGEMVVVLFATKVGKLRSWGAALAMESCTLILSLVPMRSHRQGCRPPDRLRLASCHTIHTVECRLAVGKAIHHERISQAFLIFLP
jgi:hypothetical protein